MCYEEKTKGGMINDYLTRSGYQPWGEEQGGHP